MNFQFKETQNISSPFLLIKDLKQSNKDGNFIYVYPILTCDILSRHVPLIRDFVSYSIITQVKMANVLSLTANVISLNTPGLQPPDSNAVDEDGESNYYRARAKKIQQIESASQMDQLTDFIINLMSTDLILSKYNPVASLVELNNRFNVPLIVGTKPFTVSAKYLFYSMYFAIKYHNQVAKLGFSNPRFHEIFQQNIDNIKADDTLRKFFTSDSTKRIKQDNSLEYVPMDRYKFNASVIKDVSQQMKDDRLALFALQNEANWYKDIQVGSNDNSTDGRATLLQGNRADFGRSCYLFFIRYANTMILDMFIKSYDSFTNYLVPENAVNSTEVFQNFYNRLKDIAIREIETIVEGLENKLTNDEEQLKRLTRQIEEISRSINIEQLEVEMQGIMNSMESGMRGRGASTTEISQEMVESYFTAFRRFSIKLTGYTLGNIIPSLSNIIAVDVKLLHQRLVQSYSDLFFQAFFNGVDNKGNSMFFVSRNNYDANAIASSDKFNLIMGRVNNTFVNSNNNNRAVNDNVKLEKVIRTTNSYLYYLIDHIRNNFPPSVSPIPANKFFTLENKYSEYISRVLDIKTTATFKQYNNVNINPEISSYNKFLSVYNEFFESTISFKQWLKGLNVFSDQEVTAIDNSVNTVDIDGAQINKNVIMTSLNLSKEIVKGLDEIKRDMEEVFKTYSGLAGNTITFLLFMSVIGNLSNYLQQVNYKLSVRSKNVTQFPTTCLFIPASYFRELYKILMYETLSNKMTRDSGGQVFDPTKTYFKEVLKSIDGGFLKCPNLIVYDDKADEIWYRFAFHQDGEYYKTKLSAISSYVEQTKSFININEIKKQSKRQFFGDESYE